MIGMMDRHAGTPGERSPSPTMVENRSPLRKDDIRLRAGPGSRESPHTSFWPRYVESRLKQFGQR